MTPQEAIDFIENEVQIDVRYCSDEKLNKTEEVFMLAKSALEKQVPQKTIEKIAVSIGTRIYGRCSKCNNATDSFANFCSNCGQALDWSDDK